ncbi:TPA: transporter substrate-binding domain-containing protein [Salmonella enterica]|nr:transporter substrate-binding domain-containing protein [Salmonella enterica]
MIRMVIFFMSLLTFCPVTVFAAPSVQHVKVGLYISQPFVMPEQNQMSGLAIDLWKGFAREKKLESEYTEFSTINGLLDAVSTGEVDVAVTSITITEDRARRMAFSFPWYDSGSW